MVIRPQKAPKPAVADDVFCDWLSCYQEHMQGGLPVLNDGCIAQFEADAVKQFIDPETGEFRTIFDTSKIEWTTQKNFEYEGSYGTKIRFKCDGSRLSFDGNISRFGRTDNVFGYSVLDCITRINNILGTLGLPPFTHEKSAPTRGNSYISSGCIITRIDLTRNYSAGSHAKAVRLIHYMAGQDAGRRASAKQYGENGVSWNEGSKFWYSKMYIKAESLGDFVRENVLNWTQEQGIVRHEISLKSRYLTQHGLRKINDWHEHDYTIAGERGTMENIIYGRFTDILKRGTAVRTPLEDISGSIGRIARDWRSGVDVWGDNAYTERTRRRWRKQLLAYGIDIKQPSSVTRLPIRLEVIELKTAVAPDWYWNEHQSLKVAA